jgi:hypothetical protein
MTGYRVLIRLCHDFDLPFETAPVSRHAMSSDEDSSEYMPTTPTYRATSPQPRDGSSQRERSVTPSYVPVVVDVEILSPGAESQRDGSPTEAPRPRFPGERLSVGAGSSGAGSSGAGSSGAGSSGAGSSGAGSSGIIHKRPRNQPDRFVDLQAADWEKRKSRQRSKQHCKSVPTETHIDASMEVELEFLRARVELLEEDEGSMQRKVRKLESDRNEIRGNFDRERTLYMEMNKSLTEDISDLRDRLTLFKNMASNYRMKFNEARRQLENTESVNKEYVNSSKAAESTVTAWTNYIAGAREKSKVCMICYTDFNPVLNMTTHDEYAESGEVENRTWYALQCGHDKAHVLCEKCYNSDYFMRNPQCPARCGQKERRNVREGAVKLYW